MTFRFLLGALLVSLLVACGGAEEDATAPDEGGAGQAAEEPAAEPSTTFSPPCGGMTAERAAEILEVAASEIEYQFAEELRTCSFRADLAHNLSYSVNVEANAATAEAEIGSVVEGLEFLGDCESVEDLADAAVYCGGDADRLLVRQGATWIDLLSPAGLDDKRRAAELILEITRQGRR